MRYELTDDISGVHQRGVPASLGTADSPSGTRARQVPRQSQAVSALSAGRFLGGPESDSNMVRCVGEPRNHVTCATAVFRLWQLGAQFNYGFHENGKHLGRRGQDQCLS
jgi:hypothetical protein